MTPGSSDEAPDRPPRTGGHPGPGEGSGPDPGAAGDPDPGGAGGPAPGAGSDPDPDRAGPEPGPNGDPEAADPAWAALRGEPSRLHPAAVAVWTLEAFYALVLVVLTGGAVPALGAAILAFVITTNGVRYLRFRWRLEPDALIIEQGLIRRHRRVIPRDRIQTVDLERRLRHRLFGVVEVRVETMGGGPTEGQLAALAPEVAGTLRHLLLTGAREAPADVLEEEPGEVLARVGPGALVVAGLTGSRVGVGAAIVGFASQVMPEEWLMRILAAGEEEVPDVLAVGGPRLLLLLVGLALLVGFLLSLVATVMAYWDFTLTRDGDTLRVRRGLLTLRRDTVPFRRIQAVRVEENLARRPLGLATVHLTVAGRAGADAGDESSLILPLGRREDAFRLAGEVIDLGADLPGELHPMPAGARERRLVRAAAATLVVGAVTFGVLVATGGWDPGPGAPDPRLAAALAAIVTAVPAFLLAVGAYRNLGWADLESHMVVREGALNRKTAMVPVNRLQEVETTATPFQRRRDLATLRLGIPRPPASARAPRALDLAEADAGALRESLVHRLPARLPWDVQKDAEPTPFE